MKNRIDHYIKIENDFYKIEKLENNKLITELDKKYSKEEIDENIGEEILGNIKVYFNLLADEVQNFSCTEGFNPFRKTIGEYILKNEF